MVSPSAAPRLNGCSVKDLASCFLPSRFPLDQEEPHAFCSRQPMTSEDRTGMTFASKNNSRDSKGHGKESEQCISMNSSQSGNSSGKGSSWASKGGSQAEPRFAEEDYIVFCFRENGEIHMIADDQSSQAQHVRRQHTNTVVPATAPLRPVSRKLHYMSEGIELRRDTKRGVMLNPDGSEVLVNENGIFISDKNKDEEKGSVNGRSIVWPPDDKGKDNPILRDCKSKMDKPVEYCGSNISSDNSSTGSFTFPELGIEWIGSPVHLPKTDQDQTPSCLELYCCRF